MFLSHQREQFRNLTPERTRGGRVHHPPRGFPAIRTPYLPRSLPGIVGQLFAFARSQLPRGPEGRRLILLAIVVPWALSCGVQDEGLGRVSQIAGDGGRDGLSIAQTDARSDGGQPRTDAPARLDGARDGYSPPQPDRDAGAPAPDGARPVDVRPPPDATAPDVRPPDTAPPPPDVAPGTQALLLIGDGMISPGDEAVRAHLAMMGFQVQVKQAANDQQAAEARMLAAGVALVVMSNSLPQGSGLPMQLRDVATPILCSKGALWDNLGIGQPQGTSVASSETNIQIRAEHPLAAGRRGEITVTSQGRPFSLGVPVPAATRVATIYGEPNEVLIFGLEKGAAGRFGPSPARRVGWFAHESTYLALNENGWALFDAAVRWLTGP
jgi:hypothetical protein